MLFLDTDLLQNLGNLFISNLLLLTVSPLDLNKEKHLVLIGVADSWESPFQVFFSHHCLNPFLHHTHA